jgi:hypothetical protein
MPQTELHYREAAIVGRLMKPDRGDFSPEAARDILRLQFGEEDQERIRELSRKAQEGTLTVLEQEEMENYRQVLAWDPVVQGTVFSETRRPGPPHDPHHS